eukprot:gene5574-2849_t
MNSALEEYHQWATGHRILPEPTQTQLLLSAPTSVEVGPEHACAMAGTRVEPTQTIVVLGVTVDAQRTWEPHAQVAARRARNAMHAVHRAARRLPRADRSWLMAAMAHPYLDYAQVAMAHQSAKAEAIFRAAYNRTARVAARLAPEPAGAGGGRRIWRSRPAFYELRRWPTWERRCAAARAAWAMQVWHRQHPRELRCLLRGEPQSPQPGRPQRVPMMRPLVQPRSKIFGPKMFAVWAPRVITRVLQGSVFEGLPDLPRKPATPRRGGGQPPSDEYVLQRRAFHESVLAQYSGLRTALLTGDAVL